MHQIEKQLAERKWVVVSKVGFLDVGDAQLELSKICVAGCTYRIVEVKAYFKAEQPRPVVKEVDYKDYIIDETTFRYCGHSVKELRAMGLRAEKGVSSSKREVEQYAKNLDIQVDQYESYTNLIEEVIQQAIKQDMLDDLSEDSSEDED